jgi:thiamine pyrophosphokinase
MNNFITPKGLHMTALIICGGTLEDYSHFEKVFSEDMFVICADSGANHLRRMNIVPDVLLGDFDSIRSQDFEYFKSIGTNIIKFPVEKDKTDSEIAVDFALQNGFRDLVILAATGSRLDHTLSNVFLLKKIMDRGATGRICNENNVIYLIKDSIKLKREEKCKITLLSLTEKVTGVTTKGLYYNLQDAVIEMGSSFGVSNEFVEDYAEVFIRNGNLLVIKSKD